ncbi:Crp/Fnr family transcriptional regulator [Chloroflexota bacterium]
MAVQVAFLESVPYFSGLSSAELDSVKQFIFEKTFGRGEVVLLEGESAEVLFFVVSGVVKVFKTSAEGKEQILSIVRPGESFNDVSVFDDGPNPASAQAMGPVVLYGVRRNELRIILRDYPRVTMNIIKVLAERVRQLMSLVEDLSFRHVIGRVARILLEHAGDGIGPKLRLTQQEMAAMAGTVREVVARSLKALEEEGTIKLDHHRIVIINKEALKEMVEASL